MRAADPALEPLETLVGEWSVQTSLGPLAARTTFEWILGGRYLLQRAEIDVPEAPDLHAVIAPAAGGDGFTQHYFDSRGVVRLYAMTLRDGVWMLLRESADFSPLDFAQRYTGTFEDGGAAIRGQWETSSDGSSWELDFELVYTRIR